MRYGEVFNEEVILKGLTPEILATLVGCQMEIQNAARGYNLCGKLSMLSFLKGELRAGFDWMARLNGKGYWVKDDLLAYIASLDIYTLERVKPNVGEMGGDRLCLSSFIAGETIIIHPPGGDKIDPDLVIGLNRTTA